MTSPMLLALLASGTAGAFLARWARLPMWPLTGAAVGAGALHLAVPEHLAMPGELVFLAQVAVGTSVGARLGRSLLDDFRHAAGPGLLVVATVVPLGIGLGLALSAAHGIGHLEATFGMVPGGVGEMVAAVTALDGDGAVVAAMHLLRLLVVVWTLQATVRWLQRRAERGGD